MSGFEVQYSDDGNEVCIIPKPTISSVDFHALIRAFKKQKYKYCIGRDERCGYRFVKKYGKDVTGAI